MPSMSTVFMKSMAFPSSEIILMIHPKGPSLLLYRLNEIEKGRDGREIYLPSSSCSEVASDSMECNDLIFSPQLSDMSVFALEFMAMPERKSSRYIICDSFFSIKLSESKTPNIALYIKLKKCPESRSFQSILINLYSDLVATECYVTDFAFSSPSAVEEQHEHVTCTYTCITIVILELKTW